MKHDVNNIIIDEIGQNLWPSDVMLEKKSEKVEIQSKTFVRHLKLPVKVDKKPIVVIF